MTDKETNYTFFHKRLLYLGGAEIALIEQMNSLSMLHIRLTLLTYEISPALRMRIDSRINVIVCGTSSRKFDIVSIFRAGLTIRRNKISKIICASGLIDLAILSKFLSFSYAIEDHHPIILSGGGLVNAIQLRKRAIHFQTQKKCPPLSKPTLFQMAKYTILYPLYLSLYKNADGIMVLSKFAQIERRYLFSLRTKLSYCGLSLTPSSTIIKAYKKENKKYITSICGLRLNKNLDILINAFNLSGLAKRGYQLILAGEGSERNNIQNLIIDLSLTNDVIMLGEIDDVKKLKLLSSTAVFVNSQFADYNISVNEALALGNIVITSEISQVNPIFKNKLAIVKYETVDMYALSNALKKAVVLEENIKNSIQGNDLPNNEHHPINFLEYSKKTWMDRGLQLTGIFTNEMPVGSN
jgi:glycosyltransferase involved in cell wall biosynthesis